VREVREETGLLVAVGHVIGVRAVAEERGLNLYMVFAASVVEGHPRADLNEFESLRWFARDDLHAPDVAYLSKDVGSLALAGSEGLSVQPYVRRDNRSAVLYATSGS
jgi:8-oxo-dGTP pyrophosphatase MutT (NUDIX family)